MKTKFSSGSFRSWHLWISIALSIPILIVSVTAILIAHGKSLGLKEIQINAGWLPGMQSGKLEKAEVRTLWSGSNNAFWVGTKHGFYRVEGESVAQVEGLGKADVRGVHDTGNDLIVATTKGLFRVSTAEGKASSLAKGDFWSITSSPGRQGEVVLLATAKNGKVLRSIDGGQHWEADRLAMAANERVGATVQTKADHGMVPLSKLVMDLHTGKAFFGKDYEWVWIDIVGLAMTLLTITGLVMWWRSQRRKLKDLQHQLELLKDKQNSATLRPVVKA